MTGDEHPLSLVAAFVNTFVNMLDGKDAEDALTSPEATTAWLVEHGLLGGVADAPLGLEDHARVIAAREALRALLLAHNGGPPVPEAAATLAAQAAEAPLRATVADDGTVTLGPGAAGWPAALAGLLAIIARAQADGSWSRLKACAAHDCHWAYYDATRNRSRTWCSMAVCGNRAKARAYRRRG